MRELTYSIPYVWAAGLTEPSGRTWPGGTSLDRIGPPPCPPDRQSPPDGGKSTGYVRVLGEEAESGTIFLSFALDGMPGS